MTALADPQVSAELYAREKIPLFSRWNHVTAEEIAVRITSTLTYWAATNIVVWLLFATPAIIAVALRLTEVSWMAFFGWPSFKRILNPAILGVSNAGWNQGNQPI